MRFPSLHPIYLVCISFLSFFQCGINTDTPVAPFIFLVPPSVPQILSVVAVNSNLTNDFKSELVQSLDPRPEYVLRYFVTNREPQFQGYNLYVTTAFPGVIQTIQGEWLEDGVQPSFPHLPYQASTESSKIVTKRIRFAVPPPGAEFFQKCQIYNFTLRSMLTGGLISNPSTPTSTCAIPNKVNDIQTNCPVGKGCNTTICANAACGTPTACALGTACNPCTKGDNDLGCTCPAGANPPGCQYIGP
ncbi:hypothetical protein LEP1GSC195_1986 [Leptospira wolbachii serovar Codice str. CDC]|uniref:Lipoprotein n=1 Tax=Leptospira wolbachii serovar Codice str. CDC TaxID=1218599 RepID=R9A2A9_9LEPT|nr:hypothetical protein [Leptospira wolbachii]EOQ96351.1 hypothetical protein LEP1GSC195_1986 [Leptospira wolbachii serovar Codice str. CDC]